MYEDASTATSDSGGGSGGGSKTSGGDGSELEACAVRQPSVGPRAGGGRSRDWRESNGRERRRARNADGFK
ncbi:uncharacterized protein G2W53_044742 [Senna tora]|uniref:Uncharacterized protein n=1 Tax=Senna tora TaxID=362788 RepID=A0A834SDB8_9FABA|nr:uncharacterized protein G2W53_044742 [Senna tora]